VEPTWREPEKPKDRSQRETRARLIEGAQDPPLGLSGRQTLA
jgi:hypothetical protein